MSLGRQGFSGEVSLAWLEPGASDAGKWEFRWAGEARPSRGGWGLPREGSHLCRRGDCLLQGSGAGTGLWQRSVIGVWGGWGGRELWGLRLCPPGLCLHPVPKGPPASDPPDGLLTVQSRSLGSQRLRPFCDCPPRCVSPLASVWGFYSGPFFTPWSGGFHLVPLPL